MGAGGGGLGGRTPVPVSAKQSVPQNRRSTLPHLYKDRRDGLNLALMPHPTPVGVLSLSTRVREGFCTAPFKNNISGYCASTRQASGVKRRECHTRLALGTPTGPTKRPILSSAVPCEAKPQRQRHQNELSRSAWTCTHCHRRGRPCASAFRSRDMTQRLPRDRMR